MYSRRDLVRAYLGAQQRGFGGHYAESPTFNDALAAHYLSLLDGLQRLFGLSLERDSIGASHNPALLMLFRATADSLLSLRTPWSGFLEAVRRAYSPSRTSPTADHHGIARPGVGGIRPASRWLGLHRKIDPYGVAYLVGLTQAR
jgi:hypothetical protein